jgi:hypothetical protein
MNILKEIEKPFMRYITKDFIKDRFDGKYPFDLKNQPKGYFMSFGEKNPDKIFYIIWRGNLGAGFFSNFTQILAHIKVAETLNMIPIVDFKNFQTFYNEKNPINGTDNAWEYYFKQISPYTLDEVYSSKNVFFCDGEPPCRDIWGYIADNKKEYQNFYENHIKLHENVEKELEKYSYIFDEKVLGVHFRGKELNFAALHPYGPTIKQMFDGTDELLEKYNISRILMVTEEKDYLDLFIKRYGKKVFYTDSFCVSKVNAYNLNPRENHRYLLGFEVLRDATLLAKCNGLIFSNSSVSIHSARLGNHEFSYYIENGYNFKNPYLARYSYAIKKLLPSKFGGLKNEILHNLYQ